MRSSFQNLLLSNALFKNFRKIIPKYKYKDIDNIAKEKY
nr:MAG TPA: hypothetical protein [Caudoviricetes sp.]